MCSLSVCVSSQVIAAFAGYLLSGCSLATVVLTDYSGVFGLGRRSQAHYPFWQTWHCARRRSLHLQDPHGFAHARRVRT
eukprot:9100245-Pyramimonas_sp.AAC.1